MSTIAIALLVSAVITAAGNAISLLDAVITVYLLFLPIIASAFGMARLSSATRRMGSPILILANWIRSALTYSFALYVWITAATFGSQPECNHTVSFILFGAKLPATTSGRIFNLTFWGLGTLIFLYRTILRFDTLRTAALALFFSRDRHRLLRPRELLNPDEWILATEERFQGAGKEEWRVKAKVGDWYRPARKLYKVIGGFSSTLINSKGDPKTRTIVAATIIVFSITMTELEFKLNGVSGTSGGWTFGQVRFTVSARFCFPITYYCSRFSP